MTAKELIKKLQNALNLDNEVFINTEQGEFEIQDVIVHYDEKIWIDIVPDKL